METTIWRNKWTTITIKTFYFVNHQLYLVPGQFQTSHSRGVCCTLQDMRRHWDQCWWWCWSAAQPAWQLELWQEAGGVSASCHKLLPSCCQLLPRARGGWDKSKCCDSICDAALASIISRPPTTTHHHQQLTLWTPCGRSLILARASCHQTHLETSKVIKPWKIIFKSSQDLLPDIGSEVVVKL